MSYARRTDANHKPILKRLTDLGWHISDLSRVPGYFDAVAIRGGCVRFIEVKDGKKPPSKRQLTEAQKPLHEDYTANGAIVVVLQSLEDAEALR